MRRIYPVMEFLDYSRLPFEERAISAPLCELADDVATTLPECAEVAAGLRKLLEAKDCFVRAAMK